MHSHARFRAPSLPLVLFATALVVGLITTLSIGSAIAQDRAVERTFGEERIATAVAASRDHRPEADVALIATAFDFPDSLAASALAARADAPLLLTTPGELPDAVGAELTRLGVSEALVLGGSAAIDDAVDDDIEALGIIATRLGGANRYATAAALATEAGPSATGEAVVALGDHADPDRAWPDAVAAGALAASPDRLPVLLTRSDRVPTETLEALDELDVDSVIVVGGETAISTAVTDSLAEMDYDVRRLAGASRFETGVAVAEEALERIGGTDHPVVFATGRDFPDALAASTLAAQIDAPLVIVPPEDASGAVDAFLRAKEDGWSGGVVLGGEVAASDHVIEQLDAAITGRDAPAPPEDGAEIASEDGSGDEEPVEDDAAVVDTFEGTASYYGPGFHGRPTANGETFDRNAMTAAHRTLPFNTIVRVTNLANGASVEVRINDRGPYSGGRIIDMSEASGAQIGMLDSGTAQVRVEVLDR